MIKLKNFETFLKEKEDLYTTRNKLFSSKEFIKLVKQYKQKKNNFSIYRYSNDTNEIYLKLSDDVFLRKNRKDDLYIHLIIDKKEHTYLKNLVDTNFMQYINVSDSALATKSNGWVNDTYSIKLKSDSFKSELVTLLDSLSYDGYEYSNNKLVNSTKDYIKLI